jgi:UDP:flavonoid glycosyltransferase YjiC (YdhE family)
MDQPRILYVSGSLGLGHVTRDVAIARSLRRRFPGAEISWLAVHPATAVLEQAGERVLPEAADLANESAVAEQSATGSGLIVTRYLFRASGAWRRNVEVFERVVRSRPFELVIGDETYEISLALREQPGLKRWPFVMIYDFVGLDRMTRHPIDALGTYVYNWKWSHDYGKRRRPPYDLGLFIGEPDDVPDTSFGPLLPNRRTFATAMYTFVGYVFPFDPAALADRAGLRKRLGYSGHPLVVAAIGGTAIGKHLLELCGAAFVEARSRVPSLQMMLVAGPRLAIESLTLPTGVDVRSFVPDLYEHFAASALAIVQGGATSTLELAALRRPFLYFPLEGHFEQAGVARILKRREAGIEMRYSTTTPAELAERMIGLLGTDAKWPPIPTDGARRAADLIAQLLGRSPVVGAADAGDREPHDDDSRG